MGMTDYDAQQMLIDSGICPSCKDHMPCGCDTIIFCDVCGMGNSLEELDLNNDKCYNCDSQQ